MVRKTINSFEKVKRSLRRKLLSFHKIKAKPLQYELMHNPDEIVHVPVELISFRLSPSSKREYSYLYNYNFKYLYKGSQNKSRERIINIILAGDWDIAENGIKDYKDYEALRERFIGGKKWEETKKYDLFMAGRKRNLSKYTKYNNFNDYKLKRLSRYDQLYEDIMNEGYKQQEELERNPSGEIEICVSRDGDLLFCDGKHRLTIAKLLAIETVPVVVNAWHKLFIDYVKKEKSFDVITPKTAMGVLLQHKYYYPS